MGEGRVRVTILLLKTTQRGFGSRKMRGRKESFEKMEV
jgi:hypothetical protein